MVLIELRGPQNEGKWRFYINKKAEISTIWWFESRILKELQFNDFPCSQILFVVYWNSNKMRVTDYTCKAQLDCYYFILFFLNHCYICKVSSLIYVVLDVQLICLFFFLNKYHHSTVRLGIFTKAYPIKNRTWQHTAATHPLD